MTDETVSTGVPADNTNSNDTTNNTSNQQTENKKKNDPEKNKTLAEITMMESLRDIPSYTIRVPRLVKGIHTNAFFYCQVPDDFYEKNYPELIKPIENTKFVRYSGFRKNWFYIDKVEQEMGDEWYTEISFNPLPTSLGEYVKLRQEAEKALIQAMNSEKNAQNIGSVAATTGGGGVNGSTASPVNVSGTDCTPSNRTESHSWAGHRCKPPKCTVVSKTIHGNSSRQYAKDTAQYNTSSAALVDYVEKQVRYQLYADNPYGAKRCPEAMWTGGRPIRGNCADYARMLKCILDVNGYKAIVCHIPGHFYNAIWENGGWTVCDLCTTLYGIRSYGHANHGDVKPRGTWDNPV